MGGNGGEKPCLLFGSQWYQGCSEVLKIDKLEDLRSSIARVKMVLPDVENIKNFTQCLYSSLLDNGEIINSSKSKVVNTLIKIKFLIN